MADLVPPAINVPNTAEDDPRLGHLLGGRRRTSMRSGDALRSRAMIIGFPSDEGVRINGGRAGAAEGPRHIRNDLYRLTPDAGNPDRFRDLMMKCRDLGDIALDGGLEDNQAALGDVLGSYIREGVVPIILGGGHETAFGHFLGYVTAGMDVRIVNWDAHPDVRPLAGGRAHSGSPFRQALLHSSGACVGYMVAGLLPQQAAESHVAFLKEQGASLIWRDELNPTRIAEIYRDLSGPTMVSFDLDALDQSFAPGVSAPATGGLEPRLWLHAAYLAGRSHHVRSIDVVELNPRFDRDGQTSRLAALTIWYFLKGLAERQS